MPYTSHGHPYGWIHADQPRPSVARCGGPGLCKKCSQEAAAGRSASSPDGGFERTLTHLRQGYKATRQGWGIPGRYVILDGDTFKVHVGDGAMVPWAHKTADLLADDWLIASADGLIGWPDGTVA